jgi:hypothetical protein
VRQPASPLVARGIKTPRVKGNVLRVDYALTRKQEPRTGKGRKLSPPRLLFSGDLQALVSCSASQSASELLGRESFGAQLLERALAFLERAKTHAAENVFRLRELDVAVVDDLDVVAPRVAEIEKPPR